MIGGKTYRKSVELAKQLSMLRDHIDVHRIIGINFDALQQSDISPAFAGYLQATAHNSLAIGIRKLFEPSGRNDLNSIRGVIDTIEMPRPPSEALKALANFGAKYGNAASPDDVKAFLGATFDLFCVANSAALERLKVYRDTVGAHSEYKASRDALPSHAEFESLYSFAADLYGVVAREILGVVPAPIPRTTGLGLLRILESLGVTDPHFDFPSQNTAV